MNRLGQFIAGLIGMALIGAFLIGLADSIHAMPFWVITVSVLVCALIDFYQSCVQRPRQD